eukprot:5950100-Pyramimonas_sp.AAC.1
MNHNQINHTLPNYPDLVILAKTGPTRITTNQTYPTFTRLASSHHKLPERQTHHQHQPALTIITQRQRGLSRMNTLFNN